MKTEWVRKTIRSFDPYVVAPIAQKYVINANENYLNVLSIPEIKNDFIKELDTFKPQIYPKPMADELAAALADYTGTRPEQIMAGNGGDEIITYFLGTFLDPGDEIVVHGPTFDMYALGAEVLGASAYVVKDLPVYHRDREGILRAVRERQPKITVICNPNNPTGELLPASFIEEVVKAADNLVLVDEAYMEFAGGESVLSLVSKYKNLAIIRTLSKCFALAGMRCGYIVADEEIIQAMGKIKAPYNLNSMTQLLARVVLRHREPILQVRDTIVQERERLYGLLSSIDGVHVYPSRTNFLLLTVDRCQEELFEAWKQSDILVKIYRNNPLIPNGFRISVTTEEVDNELVRIMREVMSRA
jgi:histidinol-phosphate aminotransferase